ncbi:hypothetical protein F4677DRAFT_458816 [Hypoxylon crocopeplum]|nr:hypothetical protein F4677DRAFT_458816 [Hypoxylon crocopeplum]
MAHDQPGLEVAFSSAPEAYKQEPLKNEPLYIVENQVFSYGAQQPTTSSQYGQQAPSALSESTSQEKNVKKSRFWMMIAMVAITAVVAGVAGSVGGVLAARGSKSNSSGDDGAPSPSTTSLRTAPTSTASSSAFSSASPSAMLPSPTSDANPTPSSTSKSLISTPTSESSPIPLDGQLALDCPAIDSRRVGYFVSGTTYNFDYHCGDDISSSDIQMANTTSIDDCIIHCSEYNASRDSVDCGGVVWNGNLTSAIPRGGNCYLKGNGITLSPCGDSCQLVAAAVLVAAPS